MLDSAPSSEVSFPTSTSTSTSQSNSASELRTSTSVVEPAPKRPRTSQGPRSRCWVGTINNYTVEYLAWLKEELTCKWLVCGEEVAPTTGTPHLQLVVYFAEAKTLSAAVKHLTANGRFPSGHMEPTASIPASITYCRKDGKYFETGSVPDTTEHVKSSRETEAVELIRAGGVNKVAKDAPHLLIAFGNRLQVAAGFLQTDRTWKPLVINLTGRTGTGKTMLANSIQTLLGLPLYTAGRRSEFMEGYDNEPIVLVDDFRGSWAPLNEMLRLLDRYPYRVEVKGGSRKWNPSVIIITSPHPIESYYTSDSSRDCLSQLTRRVDFTLCLDPTPVMGLQDGVIADVQPRPPKPLARQLRSLEIARSILIHYAIITLQLWHSPAVRTVGQPGDDLLALDPECAEDCSPALAAALDALRPEDTADHAHALTLVSALSAPYVAPAPLVL